MYAIIEDSGTQIKVSEGDVFEIHMRDAEAGSKVTFDKVLMVGEGDGDAKIGAPYLTGASVTGKILDEVRSEKIDVIKFKRRKGYRRKNGHRQSYLRVEITGIKS
ncbi:MAG: 50S ribosomal protein L21 [Phycisphaerales bacterium]